MTTNYFNVKTGITVGANVAGKIVLDGANGNISTTNANISGNLIVSGTSNLSAAGNVTITGGSSGQVLTWNTGNTLQWASPATGSSIANGTSNVSIPVSNGNVNTSVGGTANVLVVTSTGANVTGTVNVSGTSLLVGSVGVGSALGTATNLYVNAQLTGATTAQGIQSSGGIQSGVTTLASYFITSASTAAASFVLPTLVHYNTFQGTIGSGSTVTAQYGFNAASTLTGATTNYGFYGALASSGSAVWNLYMAGSAPNYLAGGLNIGSTTLTNAPIYFNLGTSLQYNFMIQGTNSFAGNPIGMYLNPNMGGNTTTTSIIGLQSTPIFGLNASATNATAIAIGGNCYINNTVSPVNAYGIRGIVQLASPALSATAITKAATFYASAPSIDAAATMPITSMHSFYAENINQGTLQTITNAYAYYGAQATGSATNSWNLYMAGAAPNYLAGALNVGSTTLTNAPVYIAQSTTLAYNFMMQGTNTNVAPTGMYINSNINGTASSTALVGLNVLPVFSPLVAVTNAWALTSTAYLNSSFAPVNVMAYRGLIQLSATSLTGTITNAYSFFANAPNINASATTAITNASQFYAANIAGTAGAAIGSAYAFFGAQASTNTGVTSNWNLYMNGTAPNYLAGQLAIGSATLTNGYLAIAGTQSATPALFYVGGTNTNASATIYGINNATTLIGTSATTLMVGLNNSFVVNPAVGATIGYVYAAENLINIGGTLTPTYVYGTQSQIQLGAGATGGTITSAFLYDATIAFSSSATTNITNLTSYNAGNISSGAAQTVTNAFAFYGAQATGSATNSWNLYMAGAAPNYLAGQLSIGTTTTNAAYINIVPTTTLNFQFLMQGTNTYAGVNPTAMYLNPSINGTASATSLIGLNVSPSFNPLVTVGNIWAVTSNAFLNSSFAPTNVMSYRGSIQLGSTSLTGTISNAISFYATQPTIDASATTAIAQYTQFYATNIAGTAGSGITNAIAFYGNQASSNTGVTNNWNLYMAGAAPNYLAGALGIGTSTLSTNILVTTGTVLHNAPAAGNTLTISQFAGASQLALNGSTSGTVQIQTAAAAGTWTLQLPATAGTSGYVLQTNGSGVTSWVAISAALISNGTSNVSIPVASGNVNTSVNGTANVLVVTSTGANILGTLNATGNANAGNLAVTGQLISTLTTGTAPLVVTSTTQVANLNAAAAGNATNVSTTLQTTGTYYLPLISATSSANYPLNSNANFSANLANGYITATGFVGNGSALTGITVTTISNGNSNVNIPAANGNVNISSVGVANVLVITGTGVNVAGTLNATGNANAGNLAVTGQLISTLATGTAPLVVTSTTTVANLAAATATTAGTVTTAAQPNITSLGTLNNVTVGAANSITGGNLLSATYLTGTLTTAAQPNITSVGILTSLNVNGASNLSAAGNVTITGGSSGQVLTWNTGNTLQWASPATGSSIANGTSNVNIPASGGNVNTSVGGTANVLVVTSTGANITGTANITGNANIAGALNISNSTAASNNVTGAVVVTGGAGINGNVYVGGRVGWANTTSNTSAVYQYYNATVNSLDTVFG